MQTDARTGSPRKPRLLVLGPSPDHPGGITRVMDSWRSAGLAERLELSEIHTSRWDDPAPRKLLQAVRSMLALSVALARRRADVVHLQVSTGGSLLRKFAASLLCRAFRVPYMVQVHSGEFEEWVRHSSIARFAASRVLRRSAAAVALAERWVPMIRDLGARRVVVIPNGLPPLEREVLERVRVARPDRPAGAATRPVLLFYGRFSPTKGLDRIAAALPSPEEADYEVRIFGNGDRAWVEELFAPFADRVSLGGWLDLEGKARELAGATAMVAPSRAEGFGQSLLDARAAGVPVIATGCGAAGDALAGHEPLLLLPCDDQEALAAAIGDLLSGRWPPRPVASSPPLPSRFRSEAAVEAIVALASELTQPRADGVPGS